MAKNVKIGVFVPEVSQLADTACVDTLGIMSKDNLAYLSRLNIISSDVAAQAPNVSVFYITAPGREFIPLTSGAALKATHSYTDAEVAPGNLDIVFVSGSDPDAQPQQDALAWLQQHAAVPGVDILSICTGIFICAAAGIADGKKACGPKDCQSILRKFFPKVEFVGDKYRWVQDGHLWSSGGVTNGNDLIAAYARSAGHWPKAVVDFGLEFMDIGDRDKVYGESHDKLERGAIDTLWLWYKSTIFWPAQFEYTLLVTDDGVEVLTARSEESPGSPIPMPTLRATAN